MQQKTTLTTKLMSLAQRSLSVAAVWLAAVALSPSLYAQEPSSAELKERIKKLVAQLSDSEWKTREFATTELIKIGEPAREAMFQVLRGTDNEATQRAAQILKQTRWTLIAVDTSPEVMRLLKDYEKMPDAKRVTLPAKIAATDPAGCLPILLRIARQEASEDVAFAAANTIMRLKDENVLAKVAEENIPQSRPATMRLIAWTTAKKNPAESLAMLEKLSAAEKARLAAIRDLPEYNPQNLCELFSDLEERYKAKNRQADIDKMWNGLLDPLPNHVEGMRALFEGLLEANRPQLLVAVLKKADDDKLDGRTLYLAAGAHQKLGNADLTKETLAKALGASGKSAPKHYFVADYLWLRGMKDWALMEYEKTLELAGDDRMFAVRLLFPLIDIYEEMGKPLKAAEHLETLIKYWYGENPRNTDEAYYKQKHRLIRLKAEHFKMQGNFASWEDALKALLKMKPTDPETVISYYEWLVSQNREKEAVECINTVRDTYLPLKPNDDALYDHLAWIFARTGQRLNEAKEYAEAALAIIPDAPEYLATLAEVLYQQGEKEKALEAVQKGLKNKADEPKLLQQMKRFRREGE